jgi:hypothetical protein
MRHREAREMHEKELRDLQDPNSWDDENAEVHPAVESPRAVVSVSFSREDLQRVSEFARSHGKKVSTIIREAALEGATQASHREQPGRMTINSRQGGYINRNFTGTATARIARSKSHETVNTRT